MKQLSLVLLGGVALAAVGQAHAQVQAPGAPGTSQPRQGEAIVVKGKRMPTAEAPRSATCEALMRSDPSFRAMMEAAAATGTLGPFIYLPTRMPRNPDYNAAPLSPVGAPLPDLGRGRFGVGERNSADEGNRADSTNAENNIEEAGDVVGTIGTAAGSSPYEYSDAQARADCRASYSPGASSVPGDPAGPEARGNPGYRGLTSLSNRSARGRAEIARNDKTLPLAFYLFDQNRFAESIDWFKKAAAKLPDQQGGDEASLFVGKLYLMGLKERSDPAEGVKWLKKTANARFDSIRETPQFDPKQPELNTAMGEAAVILGNVYRTGFKGIAKDLEEARKWYVRALEVGHVPAAKTLGDLYYDGVGTPRDVKKAMSYYRQAAKLGVPTAQYALAEILYAGEDGVKQDRREALLWYQAAAKSEHPGALYALAQAYDRGEGIKADPQMAIGLYKTAALQGHSGALAAMGTYFYEGRLLPKDAAMARKWFEQAARASDPDGTFNLAAMMARGEGGPKDVPRAWALMRQAAALGNATAPAALAVLERKMTLQERQDAAQLTKR